MYMYVYIYIYIYLFMYLLSYIYLFIVFAYKVPTIDITFAVICREFLVLNIFHLSIDPYEMSSVISITLSPIRIDTGTVCKSRAKLAKS